MLKAKDLHERSLEDLRELEKTLTRDVFQNRFKNFTNRLDDTSSIRKAKKDLARVLTVLTARTRGTVAAVTSEAATSAPVAKAKKVAAPKAAKSATETPAAKAEKKTKTPAKKSEAK